MTEKRKDIRGRILRDGESQRKDLTYQYRFTQGGKRHVVYAKDLQVLREKEAEIQEILSKGLDFNFARITVIQLFERYLSMKQGLSHKTQRAYNNILRILKEEDFGYVLARNVKTTEAKKWLIKLHDSGKGYKYVELIKSVMRSAFQNAYEEDIVVKNPFDFRFDFIEKDSKKRIALTQRQQEDFLEYVKSDYYYNTYYDHFNILLGTGMRISEFIGLTISDLDFEKDCISVNHQLLHEKSNEYYIGGPKTEKGKRDIPMTEAVKVSLKTLLERRVDIETDLMVDGYTGFLMYDKKGKILSAANVNRLLKKIVEEYNLSHKEQLPKITAHVFRHTFCTNMINSGMNIKTVQYLMGHASAEVTLNIYSHITFEEAQAEMQKVLKVDFKRKKVV